MGLNVSQIIDGFALDVPFGSRLPYIDKFQVGYQIGIGIENRSSRRILLGFELQHNSMLTSISDQYTKHKYAGEILSAIGAQCKIGYRFGYKNLSPIIE